MDSIVACKMILEYIGRKNGLLRHDAGLLDIVSVKVQ